jgi:hypothetical protein
MFSLALVALVELVERLKDLNSCAVTREKLQFNAQNSDST